MTSDTADQDTATPCDTVIWVTQPGSSAQPHTEAKEVIRLEIRSARPQHIVEAARSSELSSKDTRDAEMAFDPAVPSIAAAGAYEAVCMLLSRRVDVVRSAPGSPRIQADTLRRRVSDMQSKLPAPQKPSAKSVTVMSGSAPEPQEGENCVRLDDPDLPFPALSDAVTSASEVKLLIAASAEEAVPSLVVVSAIRHMGPSRRTRVILTNGKIKLDLSTLAAGIGELKKTSRAGESYDTVKPDDIPHILKVLQTAADTLPVDEVLRLVGSRPVDSNPTLWTCPRLPDGVVGRACPRMPRGVPTSGIDPADQGLRKQKNSVQCAVCDTAPVDPIRLYAESRMISMYDAPLLLQEEVKSRAAQDS